jgi:hypothetical protein
MKRICFALLVHENRDVINEQLENIRFFCPNSTIVLFHGGKDPSLLKGLPYLVCPTSQPIEWGDLTSYFINIMEWIDEIDLEYDYLINLDSDCLFAKKGFEEFIEFEMNNFDYMAAHFTIPDDDWAPGQTMKKNWHLWQPFFQLDYFYKCFGAQVISKNYIKALSVNNKLIEAKQILSRNKNEVLALEEILFSTLATTLGMKNKEYPEQVGKWLRWRPHFTEEEIVNGMLNNEDCYLVHPVHRDLTDPARKFIRSLIK